MAAKKTVGVIGAGAWGTGFAQALARGGHDVTLWAMEDDVVSSINNEHENKKFLPGIKLDSNLKASTNIQEVVDKLHKCGVMGIIDFTHQHINVPKGMILKEVDIVSNIQELIFETSSIRKLQ